MYINQNIYHITVLYLYVFVIPVSIKRSDNRQLIYTVVRVAIKLSIDSLRMTSHGLSGGEN